MGNGLKHHGSENRPLFERETMMKRMALS